ncbi:hypothetical protein [Goekera deserti]|nr:hypothetical protein [Goekera deserti]
MEPELPGQQDGIPAADAGTGAPPPAPGFGARTGEPDAAHQVEGDPAPEADLPDSTPFRTPDPDDVRRD